MKISETRIPDFWISFGIVFLFLVFLMFSGYSTWLPDFFGPALLKPALFLLKISLLLLVLLFSTLVFLLLEWIIEGGSLVVIFSTILLLLKTLNVADLPLT